MTLEQRIAHERMLNKLPVRYRVVANEEWLDDPKNWKRENRPLTPAELAYAWMAMKDAA